MTGAVLMSIFISSFLSAEDSTNSVSSTCTTASAPSGTGAPVLILIASPFLNGSADGCKIDVRYLTFKVHQKYPVKVLYLIKAFKTINRMEFFELGIFMIFCKTRNLLRVVRAFIWMDNNNSRRHEKYSIVAILV